MRIEEILEQVLFENFNQLANLYDQVVENDNMIEMIYGRELRVISKLSKEAGLNTTHPVEIFAFLIRKNQPIFSHGVKSPKSADVNFWVSSFKQSLKDGMGGDTRELFSRFLDGLIDSLGEYKEKKEFRENKDNYDVLYKGDNWILFEPHHKAASCKLGSNADWCISSKSNNYFDQYKSGSDIYIIHTRNDKYALVIDPDDGSVLEVQDSNNDRSSFTVWEVKDFLNELKSEGVDINVLFDKTSLSKRLYQIRNYKILDAQIKKTGQGKSGYAIDRYSITLRMRVENEPIDASSDFVSFLSPEDGQYYYFTTQGDPNGKFIDELADSLIAAAKNAGADIPDNEKTLRHIKDIIIETFYDEDLDMQNIGKSTGFEKVKELRNEN